MLRWLIRPNTYYDSIKLMRVSEALAQQPGVVRAAAVMATPLNIKLLADEGLLPPGAEPSVESLLVAVLGDTEASAEAALVQLEELLLSPKSGPAGDTGAQPLHTIEQAAARDGADLAVIAVPGPYAAAEAYAALRAGLHVFLFSDNVSVEDEVRLKQIAAQQDRLMMGPDCGTAIIGGVGLGFANRIDAGRVGIVGASGTGIQQVCCLLDSVGIGIACAIGTGGRDLSAPVGGSMTRRALWALEADESVDIVAVISKPADLDTSRRLQQEMLHLSKPTVVCFLGEKPADIEHIHYAQTLTEMVGIVARLLGKKSPSISTLPRIKTAIRREGTVYGLFAGGTLESEARQILDGMGVPHHLLDLGADEFTQGRAHPIIDPRLSASMLEDLSEREDRAAILIDVVLGDLAHPDPAGTLAPAIERAGRYEDGTQCTVCAVLIGTRRDPQGLDRQRDILQKAGARVFSSNARAATFAARVAGRVV